MCNNEFYYYNLPTSLIKRIEFTKTLDSVLYGENAFLGVINVVTLNELDDNMFNFYINNKNQQAVSFFNKINDNFFSDFHFSYSNPVLCSPKVYLVNVNTFTGKLFRESVRVNALEKNIGLGVKYSKDKSIVRYRIEYYKKGNFLGFERVTPLKRDKFTKITHQYLNHEY